jgi:hypothetical protein
MLKYRQYFCVKHASEPWTEELPLALEYTSVNGNEMKKKKEYEI